MRRQLIVFVSAAALALAGCSSGGSRYNSQAANISYDQQVVRSNADRVDPANAGSGTAAEGALLGAAVLAAVGCGIALLAGGKGSGCAIGAGAGAAVGAAGGYVLGSEVASQQRDYASREDYLYDVIAATDDEIEANRRATAAAQRVIFQHQQRLAELNRQYRAKQITASKYKNEIADMSVDRDALSIAVDTNRQRIAQLNDLIAEGGPGGQIALLRDRRDTLAAENRALEQELDELTSLLYSVPPEVRV